MEARAKYIDIQAYGQVEVIAFSGIPEGGDKSQVDINAHTDSDDPERAQVAIGLYASEAEALRDALTGALEFLAENLTPAPEVSAESSLRKLKIHNAILAKRSIDIDYTNARGERGWRTISPHAIDDGLVKAWCHTNQDYRQFRLDRVSCVAKASATLTGSAAYIGPEGA